MSCSRHVTAGAGTEPMTFRLWGNNSATESQLKPCTADQFAACRKTCICSENGSIKSQSGNFILVSSVRLIEIPGALFTHGFELNVSSVVVNYKTYLNTNALKLLFKKKCQSICFFRGSSFPQAIRWHQLMLHTFKHI